MHNPEGAWVNPREKRPKGIDDLSPEDVATGFYNDGPANPEEILIAREENTEEEDGGWGEWIDRIVSDAERVSEDKEAEYDWEKYQDDQEYWERFMSLLDEYEIVANDPERVAELLEKYHIKVDERYKEQLPRLIEDRDTSRNYGKRGRERRRKHKKGEDSIRFK